MNAVELKDRTKKFALRIIKLVKTLPTDFSSKAISNQIVRSGTSVAANYRAACISKSRADFINKMRICAEEADESALWLELLSESGTIEEAKIKNLHSEATQLTSIFLSSIKTAKTNN